MNDSADPRARAKHKAQEAHEAQPQGRVLSINQIVSYNLMRARRSHAWTQQDVAGLLERYTGRPWSNASVSAAERAWQGGRPRRFDAIEIVALANIFDEPISYFFLPPDDENGEKWVSMCEAPAEKSNATPADGDKKLLPWLPTADLLFMLAIHNPPHDFVGRLRDLARRYLGMTWDAPAWGVRIRAIDTEEDLRQLRFGPENDEDRVEGVTYGLPSDEPIVSDPWGRFPGESGFIDDRQQESDAEMAQIEEQKEAVRALLGDGALPDMLRKAADILESVERNKKDQSGGGSE